MSNSKETKKDQKDLNKKSIKMGLISQDSSIINVREIFNSYFEKTKPNSYIIKDKNRFEFSLLNYPQISITIHHFQKLEDINDKYINYNFFLIFIDLQIDSTKSFLEKVIDIIVEADDNNLNKKCYIYGFYKSNENENEKISEEKITSILEAKGIEYYYNEIILDDIESFSKLVECTINDCNTIMIEKYLAQKHSELASDTSNSHCNIC